MNDYNYPYSDEIGNYRYATVGGRRIKIYEKLGLSESMKISEKFSKKQIKNKKSQNNLNKKTIKKEKIFESEETIKKLKDKAEEIGRLNCCKEISEEVKKIAEENNIKAEIKQVTIFNEDGMKEIKGHYVTEINNKLYDYTGKQFLGSNNPDDIELRIYKHILNGFYAEDDIKVSTPEEAINYTKKNKEKLIIYNK